MNLTTLLLRGLLFLLPPVAFAQIIYTDMRAPPPQNEPVIIGDDGLPLPSFRISDGFLIGTRFGGDSTVVWDGLVEFDIDGDAVNDVSFLFSISGIALRSLHGVELLADSPIGGDLDGYVRRLDADASIGSDGPWFGGLVGLNSLHDGPGATGEFQMQSGYIGLRLPGNNGAEHYGWLHYEGIQNVAFVLGWAYEATPGVPIMAGAIPEQSTMGFLLCGAVAFGFGAWRRHRRQQP